MRLATWNLEHFWHVPNEPLLIRKNGEATRLRSAQFLERTRRAVQSLQADVLCLQEVGGLAPLAYLCPEAQLFCEARLDDTAIPRARGHGVGFAFSPALDITPLPEIDLRAAQSGHAEARNALAFGVNDQFIVVGLHLKSGCRDKLRLDKRLPCQILGQQVDLLCAWMARQDLPLVLMGDFNRVLSQPRDSVYKKLLDAAPDLRIAPPSFRQIDHILAAKQFRLTPAGRGGLQGYSDHRPICFDMAL